MPQAAAKRALWRGFNKGARSASKADNQPVCSREQVFNLDLEAARQHQELARCCRHGDVATPWVGPNYLGKERALARPPHLARARARSDDDRRRIAHLRRRHDLLGLLSRRRRRPEQPDTAADDEVGTCWPLAARV